MSAKYYVTLTNYGAELVAAAHDLQSITLTEIVIGDANGVPYQPIDHTDLTQLVHQTAAVEVREVKVENNSATVSAIIPAHVGGFNIHELGLKDASGKLVYIGNYHGAYKPIIAEGGGGELELVIDIKGTAGAQALIEINPLIISADKAWVQQQLNELRAYFNPLLAKPGTIEIWSNPIPPAYALECNGAAYSRTEYKDLFDVIGTAFGAGDGNTTFNVPDFRAEVPRGWDHGRGIDAGRIFGSAQDASSVFMGDSTVTASRVANLYNKYDDNIATMRDALNGEPTTINASNLSVLSSGAQVVDPITPQEVTMSVRVRNVAVMFIIRT